VAGIGNKEQGIRNKEKEAKKVEEQIGEWGNGK
jgi:hypothetical protein